MFKLIRHQTIAELLKSFNSDLLEQTECYFAGGTAISLSLNEFRESVNIDFLCASAEGYRTLRNLISQDSLGELINTPVKYLREVKTDQYKIYTILESNNIPIKLEIVREARVNIHGAYSPVLMVPMLSQEDLFTQKLLANTDRGLDKVAMSRDIIDLAIMIESWGKGELPISSWNKAVNVYGYQLSEYFIKSIQLIHNKKHLQKCLENMAMDSSWIDKIPKILLTSVYRLKEKGITLPQIEIDQDCT